MEDDASAYQRARVEREGEMRTRFVLRAATHRGDGDDPGEPLRVLVRPVVGRARRGWVASLLRLFRRLGVLVAVALAHADGTLRQRRRRLQEPAREERGVRGGDGGRRGGEERGGGEEDEDRVIVATRARRSARARALKRRRRGEKEYSTSER